MLNWIKDALGQEATVFFMVAIMFASIAMGMFFKKWTARQDKTSVFKNDTSLEDVGINVIGSLFESHQPKFVGDYKELRPTLGARILLPIVALIFFFTTDFSVFWQSLGFETEFAHKIFTAPVVLVLAYTWVMLAFVQKVKYDRSTIEVCGVDLTNQKRNLTEIISIEKHPKRPILVLEFSKGKNLNVPLYLSKRNEFVKDMKEIIAQSKIAEPSDQASISPFKFYPSARRVG